MKIIRFFFLTKDIGGELYENYYSTRTNLIKIIHNSLIFIHISILQNLEYMDTMDIIVGVFRGNYMGEIVIEKINFKDYIMVLVNLLLLIATIAVALYGFEEHKARYWLPGLFFCAVFFVSFLISIFNARQVKRLITITREGIVDNSYISGRGFISFDEIKDFVIINVNYKEAIAVIPKNIDSFLLKLNMVKRSVAKRNINANLPPVIIPVNLAKDMDPEDILSLLKKRLLDYSSLSNY